VQEEYLIVCDPILHQMASYDLGLIFIAYESQNTAAIEINMAYMVLKHWEQTILKQEYFMQRSFPNPIPLGLPLWNNKSVDINGYTVGYAKNSEQLLYS
jgi:hypothetical protein